MRAHKMDNLILYTELQEAYSFFNDKIFDSKLPNCLITLQRGNNKFYGYASYGRFTSGEGIKIDELAMNPSYFGVRSIKETLSTLCHEQVHIWQYHFGTISRNGYHNKEWADKMESIGLMPSHTAQKGGKRTGDRMSHYVIKGGLFDRVCDELITKQFCLSWIDRFPPHSPETISRIDKFKKILAEGKNSEAELEKILKASLLFNPNNLVIQPSQKKDPSKIKYSCPSCLINVWGKINLNILCGDCNEIMEEN